MRLYLNEKASEITLCVDPVNDGRSENEARRGRGALANKPQFDDGADVDNDNRSELAYNPPSTRLARNHNTVAILPGQKSYRRIHARGHKKIPQAGHWLASITARSCFSCSKLDAGLEFKLLTATNQHCKNRR